MHSRATCTDSNMRLRPISFSLLTVFLSFTSIANTTPLPRDEVIIKRQNSTLELRDCPSNLVCGWDGQYCCASGQSCITSSTIALCEYATAAAVSTAYSNGQWEMFTTTYVETDLETIVTVYSSFIPVATQPAQTQVVVTTVEATSAPAQTVICNANLGQVSCGNICCAQGQFCAYSGQCQANGGSSTNVIATFVQSTAETTASAFIRPTSATTQTVIETGTFTATVPFQTPVGTDGSSLTGITATQTNTGLSGGAIAGIVIGVLLAILFLFLLCVCCLGKAVFDTILGLFGLGKNARRRRVTDTTIIEERHSRHGGRVTGGGRTWYGRQTGDGPSRPQKKTSGWTEALGIGAALTTLYVVLGLKRKKDEKSQYTASSYSYSDYTSESEF